MSPVTIYTTPHCPYCLSAKRLLSSKASPLTKSTLKRHPCTWRK